jgi:hypothetical protein
MEQSLKQIIAEVKAISDAHLQLRSFRYGDVLDILKGERIEYACLFMNVSNATINNASVQLVVELLAMDKTFKDDKNKVDVENTMLRVINDISNVMNYSNRWNVFSDVLTSRPSRKYYDNYADVVTGWGMTVTIDVYNQNGICDLPLVDYDYDTPIPDGPTICPTKFSYNLFVNGVFQSNIIIDVNQNINITT